MVKADFHVHTVLSPCGDIEMTPAFIISRAKECGLSIVGITDHNSTLEAVEVKKSGDLNGVFILTGAEVTTSEEIHLLVYVNGNENLKLLQDYLERKIIKINNRPEFFGYQLVVDEFENVLQEVDYLLINALSDGIAQVEQFVHSLGGIVIPAHINKNSNSLLSQLGFIPSDSAFDALEVIKTDEMVLFNGIETNTSGFRTIVSSDAHYRESFGEVFTLLDIEGTITFEKIKLALYE